MNLTHLRRALARRASPPARAKADAQGLQLRPDLAGAGVLDLTAPNH
jgi:hypothetical protein